jgi:superkiller protein 3
MPRDAFTAARHSTATKQTIMLIEAKHRLLSEVLLRKAKSSRHENNFGLGSAPRHTGEWATGLNSPFSVSRFSLLPFFPFFLSLGIFGAAVAAFPQGMSIPREFSSLAGADLAGKKDAGQPDAILNSVAAGREAVRKNPQSAEAYLALARGLEAAGETAAAGQALDRAVELDPRLGLAWYRKGLLAARDQNWHAAIQDFERALEAGLSPARLELGEMLLRSGDFDKAARELETVVRLDPKEAGAHYGLGLIRLQQGNFDAGAAAFRQALVLRPKYVDAQEGLGEALLRQQAWSAAAAAFEQILTDKPDSSAAMNGLATALARMGEQERAEKEFAEAQRLARRSVQLHRAQGDYNRGLELWHAKDLTGAAIAFRNALTAVPDYAEAHNNLGGVLWQQNDQAGACVEFEAAVHSRPDLAEARNNWGNALVYFGHIDQAIKQFRSALAARPGLSSAHLNLGTALAQKQCWAEAEQELRRTLVLAPDTAKAHVVLGLVLASKAGTATSEARAELEGGLRLDPSLRSLVPEELMQQLR